MKILNQYKSQEFFILFKDPNILERYWNINTYSIFLLIVLFINKNSKICNWEIINNVNLKNINVRKYI